MEKPSPPSNTTSATHTCLPLATAPATLERTADPALVPRGPTPDDVAALRQAAPSADAPDLEPARAPARLAVPRSQPPWNQSAS